MAENIKQPAAGAPQEAPENSEGNAKHWFYEMETWLEAQYTWEVIKNASGASQNQQSKGKPMGLCGPKCYSCQEYGHIAAKCLNQENEKEDDC